MVDSRMVVPIKLKHQNPQCQSEQDAIFRKGLSFFESKKYKKALKAFDAVLDLEPTHKETLLKVGISYYYLGDLEAACSNWWRVRNLGNTESIELLRDYCSN